MDSMDLEREKGITILAKNTAVRYRGVKLNIVDTPGPRRLRRRGRARADDGRRRAAARRRLRGAAAADALRAAQGARGAAAGDPRRQQGRPARTRASPRSSTRSTSCSSTSTPTRSRSSSRSSTATRRAGRAVAGGRTSSPRTSRRCSTCCSSTSRAPRTTPSTRCRRTSRTSTPRPYVGRLALCRVRHGTIRKGQAIAWCRADGTRRARDGRRALRHRGARPRRRPTRPGRARSSPSPGSPEVTIGETLADPDDPRPLPVITRRRAVAVGHDRHQHLAAGRPGRRQAHRAPGARPARPGAGRQRLAAREPDTERPDAWEVQGRGELQLAVLVELMRREGFELTVGQPQVLTREIDGKTARAGRAAGDRRPRGLRRRGHPAARAAQGPPGADGQPRHRLGADGVPRAGARR